MLELLVKAGCKVEPETDGPILDALEKSISFDTTEKIGIIEDMYAAPDKKAALMQILEETLGDEQAILKQHPEQYRQRLTEARDGWDQVQAHFRGA